MPTTYKFTFKRTSNGLAIYADELHVRTIPDADRAEPNEQHGGYNFYDSHGALVTWKPDWLLQRTASDKAKSIEFGKLLNQAFG